MKKLFIILTLFGISAVAAYSQNCNSHLKQAQKLLADEDYCEALKYYKQYAACDRNADVVTEIAMCERRCKLNEPRTEEPKKKESSQDIIVLKNGDEIKAVVQEIGDDYVLYKTSDNLSGPVHYKPIDQVFMIRYGNGEKEVFNVIAKQETRRQEPQKESNKQETQQYQQTQSEGSNIYSEDLKKEFDKIGKKDKVMLEFFRKHNYTDYYNRFNAACRKRNSGKALLGVGMGLTGVGVVLVPVSIFALASDNISAAAIMVLSGYVSIGVGQILTIVSIPVSASAGKKKKTIKNDFAMKYFGTSGYTYMPEINVGITQNGGMGLTLKF